MAPTQEPADALGEDSRGLAEVSLCFSWFWRRSASYAEPGVRATFIFVCLQILEFHCPETGGGSPGQPLQHMVRQALS